LPKCNEPDSEVQSSKLELLIFQLVITNSSLEEFCEDATWLSGFNPKRHSLCVEFSQIDRRIDLTRHRIA